MLTIEPDPSKTVSFLSPEAEKIIKRLLGKKAWEKTLYAQYEPLPPCDETFPYPPSGDP